MKKCLFNNKKGVTLIELILALALFTVIIALTFNMLIFGTRAQNMVNDEYEIQSAGRLAAQSINQAVRSSTALFTINRSSFREDNLTENWDYFGLSPDKREVVKYVYVSATSSHRKEVVVPAQDGITYSLVFHKTDSSNDNRLLGYTLEAVKDGSVVKKIELESELEALNSLQVVDRGTYSDPAVAIAYRSDDRPQAVYGAVTMVLDTSGSMDDNIWGNYTNNTNSKRITIMKNEAKALVEEFSKEQNISISLIPFATSANNPGSYYNVASQKNHLINEIDSFSAVGGTNTGDGLRRAYHNMVGFTNSNPTLTVRHYLVILVDGVTTFYTYYRSGGYRPFYYGGLNISDHNGVYYDGYGNRLDPDGTDYVNNIGNNYIQDSSSSIYPVKPYVIGFSGVSTELGSIADIASAVGAGSSSIFQYSPTRDLGDIFDEIRQAIINDLWVVNGPAR
jgi:prepilin-type N-terminal cleavage/methylation domain-containing protein